MAIITNSIGSAGRDYATLALWQAAIPSNVVASGNSYVGQCYNDSQFSGTTTLLDLTGFTTDSSHTITLTTGPGQSFLDNANVRTNALRFNSANGVSITSSGAVPTIKMSAYCFISNLQVENTGSGYGIQTTGLIASISHCIIDSVNNYSVGAFSGTTTIDNSLCEQAITGFSGNTVLLYFCTIPRPSDSSSLTPLNSSGAIYTLENCALFNATDSSANLSAAGVTVTTTACMSNCTSLPTGTTFAAYANQFVNTVYATGDFRSKVGANLIGAGTSDPTNGATDISGLPRPQGSNWDIGAWEAAAVSGCPHTLLTMGAGCGIWAVKKLEENPILTRRGLLVPRLSRKDF